MFVSGKYGRITLAGSQLRVKNWSANVDTDLIDASHTEGSGFREYISGLTGGAGSLDAIWDKNDPATAKVPNITRGRQFAFQGYVGPNANNQIISGTIQVSSVAVSAPTDAEVTFTINFTFSGTITAPS